tara:strand:+ start:267 stop:794 length:528 start_codon:yes stop_codon:yes gene_type:complete
MSELSIAELELQVDTDLTDIALQQIIDAVESDIDDFIGPVLNRVFEFDEVQLHTVLRLPSKASSIDSIVEYTSSRSDPTKTTLASNDYELSTNGWEIRRLSDGTNARSTWGWHLIVQFDQAEDLDRRKQVAIQLCRLEIINTGYTSESIGDWSATMAGTLPYKRILSRLDNTAVT